MIKQLEQLEQLNSFQLTLLTAETCAHCQQWKLSTCSQAPDDLTNFSWSSLTTCNKWNPIESADIAGQILTMRRLRGEDIKPSNNYDESDNNEYY